MCWGRLIVEPILLDEVGVPLVFKIDVLGKYLFFMQQIKKKTHARPDALSSCIGQLVLFDNFQLVLSFTFLRVRKIIHIVLSVVS